MAAVCEAPEVLRVNELLFVTAWLENGRNGKRAYLQVHPGIKASSAEVGAARMLGLARVQAEIARRIQHEGGITKALLESTLLEALAWANQKQDHLAAASIAMDCAKLAGFLVERREITTVPAEESTRLRDLVRSSLMPLSPSSLPLPSSS